MNSTDPEADPALNTATESDVDSDTGTREVPDRVRRVAHVLDDAIPIPGTGRSFGLDPIVSLLPVSGDVLSALASVYIIVEGFKLGVSRGTVLRMLFNVGLDTVIGSFPVLGDLFDAGWKANARNVALLESSDPVPSREAGWGFLVVALVGFILAVLIAVAVLAFALLGALGAFIGSLPF